MQKNLIVWNYRIIVEWKSKCAIKESKLTAFYAYKQWAMNLQVNNERNFSVYVCIFDCLFHSKCKMVQGEIKNTCFLWPNKMLILQYQAISNEMVKNNGNKLRPLEWSIRRDYLSWPKTTVNFSTICCWHTPPNAPF